MPPARCPWSGGTEELARPAGNLPPESPQDEPTARLTRDEPQARQAIAMKPGFHVDDQFSLGI
jgi:hypothetical protein